MKQNLSVIAVFFVALFGLVSYSASAQDGNPPYNEEKEMKELSSHPELNLGDDKTLINEIEQTKPNNQVPPKEISAGKSKPKVANAKEEKDALSFNFLYYIIEKFKYTDIVD